MNATIGATSWVLDNTPCIRTYTKQPNGYILERCVDGGANWYNGSLTDKHIVSTGLGATSYLQNNQLRIRVYGADENGHLLELCFDQGVGWYVGSLTGMNATCTSTPGATARINTDGSLSIRVYAYDANNVQREYCFDEGRGWYDGAYTE